MVDISGVKTKHAGVISGDASTLESQLVVGGVSMRLSGGMQHGLGFGMRGGQQPQPQRQRQRNNRFRGSRFDQNRGPQQNQRGGGGGGGGGGQPNKEIKQDQNKTQQQPKPQQTQPAQEIKPTPVPAPVQTPAQPAQNKTTTPAVQNSIKTEQPKTNATQNTNQQNKPAVQNTTPKGNNTNQQQSGSNMNANKGNMGQQGANVNKGNMGQSGPASNMNKGNMNQSGASNMNKGNGPQGANNNKGPIGNNSGSKNNSISGGGNNGPQKGNQRRFMGNDKMGGSGNREEHFMISRLKEISGPTIDLPPLEQTEQKFSGRNRLYIGNLTNDVTEQEIQELFSPYGETSELFINKDKNFAFIRIDYKLNAEKAKREVDGRMRRGRPLRVRFAPHNAAVKVKNLTPFVSNELLYRSFEIFGKIERAYVRVDERGKSLGEGIVEFMRKAGALAAIRHCTSKCFFLTASLKPVVVESFEEVDELDGYAEKSLMRKNQDYMRAREVGPRFAEPGSFEHEYGTRWKQLHELYKQKEDALRREMHMEEDKLEAQMEYAKYEHETEMLREQLRQREQDTERQKRTWEMTERQVEERREKERENILRQQEDMAQRMRHQEDELRRRQQENTLFMQAQQLSRILDEQEQGMGGGGRGYDNSMQDKRGNGPNMGGSMQMDAPYMEHYDAMCGGGHMGYDDGMGRWDNRQDDYPNKRRRY